MATLGALTIDISANVARIQKDVEQIRGGFRKLNSDVSGVSKTMARLETGIKAIGAAAASIYALGRAWDLAMDATKAQQMEQGFANLAASHGVNSRRIIENLRQVSGATLSTANIMQSAGKAMILGIPANELTKMMEIARASSRITGDSVQKAFDDIATGIGRQSKLILDNLGIVVSVEKANEEYAATLGKTASKLTDAEKKQAFLNATMKAGEDIVRRVNVQNLTAAEGMAVFTAKVADLRITLGKGLVAISSFISAGLLALSSGFAALVGHIANILAKIISVGSKLPWIGERFKAASEALKEFADFEFEASQEAVRMSLNAYEVGKSMFKQVEATNGVIKSTQSLIPVDEEATEAAKKRAEALKKLIEKMDEMRNVAPSPAVNMPEAGAFPREKLEDIRAYYDSIAALRKGEIDQLLMLGEVQGEAAMKTAYYEEVKARAINATAQFAGNAYMFLSDQLATLIATSKFSARAFGKAMFKMAADTILAIGQQAAIKAVFAYAEAAWHASYGNLYSAGLAKSAAVLYGNVALGAFAVGTALSATSSGMGGEGGGEGGGAAQPVFSANPYTGSPTPIMAGASGGGQNITLIVNALDPRSVNWDRLMEENIAPALERLSGNNTVLNIKIR